MGNLVKLTDDEIRTVLLIVDQYRAAAARMAQAQELEAQYMAQLRDKYGLDDGWRCVDVLRGFEATKQAEEAPL